MLRKYIDQVKTITWGDVASWTFALIVLFLFIVSTIVFPIIHLSKAVPLQSEFESVFNDVCDCVDTANLLQLGARRTALGQQCLAMYNNPIFDDVAPIEKFFGHAGYRPDKYDNRADILNNVTSQSEPNFTPPSRGYPVNSGSDSDSSACHGSHGRFDGFRAGIAFCFISLISILFICPCSFVWYNYKEILECIKKPPPVQAPVVNQPPKSPIADHRVEIQMYPRLDEDKQKLPSPNVGAELMIQTIYGNWMKSWIVETDLEDNRIKIHYIGSNDDCDEWIDLEREYHRVKPMSD